MGENELQIKRIGERIREVRIEKNMSQADLSVKTHIALSHISDIELGKKQMLVTTFIRILEGLQVSADRILRADVPEVNAIYQEEFQGLLSDCTPGETESILRIVKELKSSFRQKKTEYED